MIRLVTISVALLVFPFILSHREGPNLLTNRAISEDLTVVNVCDETNSNNSFIYCYGRILEAVNFHSLFKDSKTFVDMPMKHSPEDTLRYFEERFGNLSAEEIQRNELAAFVDEYFSEPGTELEPCIPTDWTPEPKNLMRIVDPKLKKWALQLNAIWLQLCRKMKTEVEANRNSLIYVPHEFIVPGGRFREFYYWDAYWIIKGLVASGMLNTTRSMILNFASVVNRYGFIPNGGRIYYLQRSHPPMLTAMVYEHFEKTHDKQFLIEMLPVLLKEFEFWSKNRTVSVRGQDGESYKVFQYRTESNVPRPESYREDVAIAKDLPVGSRKKYYQDAASAAESGWDFSTRWFSDKKSLNKIETTNIAPIDLNAFMCWNMDILSYLLKMTGNKSKAKKFRQIREEFRSTMQSVFYNDTEGAWFDYNIRLKEHNKEFYPAIAVPLFTECYQLLNMAKSQRVIEHMNASGAFNYAGGVPTSLIQGSNQQWDFPNGWSPLNHMIIEGLRKSDNPLVQEEGFRLAQKWVEGNYKVYKETGHMWEKYDVNDTIPQPGAGGEYAVQDGFGWTNGVVLDLLTTYYNRLAAPNNEDATHIQSDEGRSPSAEAAVGSSAKASSLSIFASLLSSTVPLFLIIFLNT